MRISSSNRSGLTLTEVVVSLLIFMMSYAAISQLMYLGNDRAIVTKYQQEGVFLCQSKLAEYASGVLPLESQNNVAYELDKAWNWSGICEQMQQEEPVLWKVEVRFEYVRPNGRPVTVVMSKLILDPLNRGSTLDPAPPPAVEVEGEEGEEGTDSSATGGG